MNFMILGRLMVSIGTRYASCGSLTVELGNHIHWFTHTGRGFDGKCIPKDTNGMVHNAAGVGYDAKIFERYFKSQRRVFKTLRILNNCVLKSLRGILRIYDYRRIRNACWCSRVETMFLWLIRCGMAHLWQLKLLSCHISTYQK